MWLWHAQKAPKGRHIFQQERPDGTWLDIGHERAMFNKLAAVVIAYSDSSATPRGLYEIGIEGAARSISESNLDSHCNISTDGRWAVVSTLGSANVNDESLDLCNRAAATWATSTTGYVSSDIVVVNMQTGARQFLFHSANAVASSKSQQPYEPQPSISPNGKWVLVKDARERRVLVIELDEKKLNKFLD